MILEVTGLHCHYGPVHAVKGMDFAVDQGEAIALIGANGAGKTTTLRAIVGTLRPSGGSIRLDGQDLVKDPGAPACRARHGVCPRRASDPPDLQRGREPDAWGIPSARQGAERARSSRRSTRSTSCFR